MSEFIRVEIDLEGCAGISRCGECVKVCPVNIFRKEDDTPAILEENEDECTLCDLCIKACSPGVITVRKLYE